MTKSHEGFEVKLVNEITESIKNSGAAIGEALRSIYVNSLVEHITSGEDKETTKERLREYIVKNEKEKRELKKSIIKVLEDTFGHGSLEELIKVKEEKSFTKANLPKIITSRTSTGGSANTLYIDESITVSLLKHDDLIGIDVDFDELRLRYKNNMGLLIVKTVELNNVKKQTIVDAIELLERVYPKVVVEFETGMHSIVIKDLYDLQKLNKGDN